MSKITNSKVVYSGKILDVEVFEIAFDGDKRTFELIQFHSVTGVSILPVTSDNVVILVDHFRLGIEKEMLTVPSGALEHSDTDPEACAQRELQEEIGMKAGKLTLMGRVHILPSYIGSPAGYLYLAKDLTEASLPGDEPFEIAQVRLPVDEAIEMVQSGEIQDARTVQALLMYQQFYRE